MNFQIANQEHAEKNLMSAVQLGYVIPENALRGNYARERGKLIMKNATVVTCVCHAHAPISSSLHLREMMLVPRCAAQRHKLVTSIEDLIAVNFHKTPFAEIMINFAPLGPVLKVCVFLPRLWTTSPAIVTMIVIRLGVVMIHSVTVRQRSAAQKELMWWCKNQIMVKTTHLLPVNPSV